MGTDYLERVPLIGGLLELGKSRKGWVLLISLIINGAIIFGEGLDAENADILIAALTLLDGLVLSYVLGQSYVDGQGSSARMREIAQRMIDQLGEIEVTLEDGSEIVGERRADAQSTGKYIG